MRTDRRVLAPALLLVLFVSSPALAQIKPIACAYDQFSSSEILRLGQLASRGDDDAIDELDLLIVSKVETCPEFKSMKPGQAKAAQTYAVHRAFLDVSHRDMAAQGSPDLVETIWATLTPAERKMMTDQGVGTPDDVTDGFFEKLGTKLADRNTDTFRKSVLLGLFGIAGIQQAEKSW